MIENDQQPFLLEPLASHHDRAAFSCGVPALDEYLRTPAAQDMRRGVAVPYILVHRSTRAVAGYVTLGMYGIVLRDLPQDIARRLPKYDAIPTVLIGRLAVSTAYQGMGLGSALLHHAMDRAEAASHIAAAFAIMVDAKDDRARSFYEHNEFMSLPDNPYRLILPMKAVRMLLDRAGFR